jgi:peptidyl-prolyl cis-trans isomerase B (cyclophilin B)
MADIADMKSILLNLLVGFSACALVSGCQNDKKDAAATPTPAPTTPAAPVAAKPPAEVKEVAVITTSAGVMVAEFWPEVAPKTVENFKALARTNFYDGTAFHRIMKGFMIQGGDPNTKDPAKEGIYGSGGPGYMIKAEFNDRPHVRGVLSMARSSDPDSAGSQFFIVLDAAPGLDHQYTTFGKLIKGEDVLMKLGDSPVGPNGPEMSKPLQRVGLESIKIVNADTIK